MARRSKNSRYVFFVLVIALIGLIASVAYVPDVSRLKRENPEKTAFMEYREREWKREGRRYRIQQQWVPLARISPYLIKAVLIAEDDKFWTHDGFDFDAIQKALAEDLKARRFKRGGSTVSQQLAKNLYLSPSKNPLRKIREAILTWRLEHVLTKRRILELYLNVVEWGEGGIFGIEMASRRYFGKSASELGPEEAARLAAVLPNPRRYHPLGDSRFVERRAERIYAIMVKRGIVVPEYEEIIQDQAGSHSAGERGDAETSGAISPRPPIGEESMLTPR